MRQIQNKYRSCFLPLLIILTNLALDFPTVTAKNHSAAVKAEPDTLYSRLDEKQLQPAPVNPKASSEARALLSYLYECKGSRLITGMHNNQAEPNDYYDKIHGTTGKFSGVWGSDFRYGDHAKHRRLIIETAIEQWNKGALITLMYHQVRPQDDEFKGGWGSVQGDLSQSEWQNLVTPGSELHNQWLAKIDTVAGWLKILRDASVPVLWRPYHEMNGGWFWWGKHPGRDGFQKLWILMYERYVHVHDLDNLLWVFNPNAPNRAEEPHPYFPGHDYVDVLAYDYYGESPYRQEYYDGLKTLAQGKPLAIAECGPLPDPNRIKKTQPGFVWFMGWRDVLYNKNSEENIINVWQHPYCLNRGDSGDFTSWIKSLSGTGSEK